MWFKTRVGFVGVTLPSDILVQKFTNVNIWGIAVCPRSGPEISVKNFLGHESKVASPSSYLAMFSDAPDMHKTIGECMAQIEAAIRTKAEFCDLSQSGDPQAWKKSWQQIQWPSQNNPPQ